MKRLLMVAMMIAGLGLMQVNAAEKKAENGKKAEPASELKDGDKGTMTGKILKIEDTENKDSKKVTVEEGGKQMMFRIKWLKGAGGGGYDKAMLAKIETLKAGDKVKVTWSAILSNKTNKVSAFIETIDKAE